VKTLNGNYQSEGFKRDIYDLSSRVGKYEFAKDVIAMANTPREHPAHVLLGVDWKPGEPARVVGLADGIDDTKFQGIFGSDLIYPTPRFTYAPMVIDGKHVGVVEIPIDKSGPFIPAKDCSGDAGTILRAGTIYYRQGTTNAIATGPRFDEIIRWFGQDKKPVPSAEADPELAWDDFARAVYRFESGRYYLLVTDSLPPDAQPLASPLGLLPWVYVVDFNPNSETNGLLRDIGAALRTHRPLHLVVKGDRPSFHSNSTYWFFARGLAIC